MSVFSNYFATLEKNYPAEASALKHLEAITLDYFSCVEHFNFTGHKTPHTFFYKNILDSIAPFFSHKLVGKYAIDIGTGGGFPGVPVAVLTPHLTWILTDSVQKKLSLIHRICKDHHLPHVSTLQARVEELGQKHGFREHFDIVTAKALAHIPTLLEYALPLLRIGGSAYLYVSAEQVEELEGKKHIIQLLGGELKETLSYTLGEEGTRYISIIQKVSSTPSAYPRKVGIPKHTPLQ